LKLLALFIRISPFLPVLPSYHFAFDAILATYQNLSKLKATQRERPDTTTIMAGIAPMYGPTQARKTFVLCFDGTGNKFSGTASDSNILKIFRMLDRTDPSHLHYYQVSSSLEVGNVTVEHLDCNPVPQLTNVSAARYWNLC
jgi:hypothetical protein